MRKTNSNSAKKQSCSENPSVQNHSPQCKKFLEPNSWLRCFVARISDFMNWFYAVYIGIIIVVIPGLWLLLGVLSLQDDERIIITGLISTVFSVIVAPFVLSQHSNHVNHRFQLAKENLSLYYELCEILMTIIESKTKETKVLEDLFELIDAFIRKHKAEVQLLFSSVMIDYVCTIRNELKHKSIQSAQTYSRLLLKKVRKQLDAQGYYYIWPTAFSSTTSTCKEGEEKVAEQYSEKTKKVKV